MLEQAGVLAVLVERRQRMVQPLRLGHPGRVVGGAEQLGAADHLLLGARDLRLAVSNPCSDCACMPAVEMRSVMARSSAAHAESRVWNMLSAVLITCAAAW